MYMYTRKQHRHGHRHRQILRNRHIHRHTHRLDVDVHVHIDLLERSCRSSESYTYNGQYRLKTVGNSLSTRGQALRVQVPKYKVLTQNHNCGSYYRDPTYPIFGALDQSPNSIAVLGPCGTMAWPNKLSSGLWCLTSTSTVVKQSECSCLKRPGSSPPAPPATLR